MKKLFFFLFLFFINSTFSNTIYEIKLEKSEKLESTYTAEIGNGNTIHFMIIKNTSSKDFSLVPLLVDSNKNVKKMDSFTSKKTINIISYHLNNDTATIIAFDADNKQLQFIDFDLSTGKNKSSSQESKTIPDNIFRLKNKTLLVSFDKKENQINIKSVTDSNQIEQTQITIPKDKIKLFDNLTNEIPEAINQEEFVEKGSISKRKAYFYNNNLIYTFEKNKNETQLFNFNLKETKDFVHSSINLDFTKEIKDVSNYFYDNKIVFLGVEKQNITLKIFDASSLKQIGKISADNDLNAVIKSDVLSDYIKTALKSSIKSTITINKTKSNQLAIHLDNVKETDYHYNYNWYFTIWFFQQQMMMQQQMMQQQVRMNTTRSFGPSPENYCISDIVFETKKYSSIEFILTSNFTIAAKESVETIYPKIDKEKFIDKYKDDNTIKNFTSGFTTDEVRIIYQDSKSKTIIVSTEKLTQE